MAVFLQDSFTDTDATLLSAHTGETGASWTRHPADPLSGNIRIDSGRIRASSGGDGAFYYASGTPADADYDVEAVFRSLSSYANVAAILGRLDATALTCYRAFYSGFDGLWHLDKFVGGANTSLDTFDGSEALSTDYTVKLEMRGTTIKVYIDGVEVMSATDSAISAAGHAGVEMYDTGGAATGWQISSITGTDTSASGSDVTGTAACSFGSFALTADGIRTVLGAADADVGSFVLTADGLRTILGAAAASGGSFSLTADGKRTVLGSASGGVGSFVLTASGTIVVDEVMERVFGILDFETGVRVGTLSIPTRSLSFSVPARSLDVE